MSNQENGDLSLGHFTLLVDVISVSRQKVDTLLVVFRDEKGVKVTIELLDSAARKLKEQISVGLPSA